MVSPMWVQKDRTLNGRRVGCGGVIDVDAERPQTLNGRRVSCGVTDVDTERPHTLNRRRVGCGGVTDVDADTPPTHWEESRLWCQ